MGVKVSRCFVACFLLAAPLLALLAAPATAADVVYSDKRTFNSLTLPVRGNLTVGPGADVTFVNSQILFNGTKAGERQLWVQPGGRLKLQHSIVQGDSAPFRLLVEGTLILEESEVRPIHALTVGGNPNLSSRLSANSTKMNVTGSMLVDRGVANVTFQDARLELSGAQGDYRLNASHVWTKRTTFVIAHQGLSLANNARLDLDSATFAGKAYGVRCADSRVLVLRTTLSANVGYALDAANCNLELRNSTISSQNGDAIRARDGILASTFTFIQAPKGNGVLLDRVIASLKDFNASALQDAFTVTGATSTVTSTNLHAASTGRNAFVCAGATGLTITGGKWRGDASAGVGENCGGVYRNVEASGAKSNAVRWDAAPGAPASFESFKILKTVGPAFLMTGPATVGRLNVTDLARVVEWTKPEKSVELGAPLIEAPLTTACFQDTDGDDVVDSTEGIYLQVKACGVNSLSTGDLRIAGAATKPVPARLGIADTAELNAPTKALPANSRYAFANQDTDTAYSFRDYLYLDLAGGGTVTPGDVRLSDTGAGRAFTRVAQGDGDANAAFALVALAKTIGSERFQDADGNSAWGALEGLYLDVADDSLVSSGDLRVWNANRAYAAGTSVLPPAAGGRALVHNVTYAGNAQCVVCVQGGAYWADHITAKGDGTGVKATAATLQLKGGNLTGVKVPLNLTDTSAASFDTALQRTASKLLRSTFEAKFDFRPWVRFKNDVPVEGANVQIRNATNALLKEGTTDSTGRSAGLIIRAFFQNDAAATLPQDLKVRIEFKGVSKDVTLSTLAFPFGVVLPDDTPPTDLKNLRLTSAANRQRLTLAWDASTDNLLPPSYVVDLALPAGTKQIVKGGVRVDYAGERVTTTSATTHGFDLPGEGVYDVTVRAVDKAGNLGKGVTLATTWDQTKPVITLTPTGLSGSNGWWRGNLTVRMNATDNVSFIQSSRLELDGARAANAQAPLAVDSDGQHEVQAVAVDATGNIATATLELRVDSQAPAIPTLVTERAVFNDPARVPFRWVGEPTDRLSGVVELRLMRDDGSGQPETVDRFLPPFPNEARADLRPGVATYYLLATDRAGNSAESPGVRVVVDRVAPVLQPLATRSFPAGTALTFGFTDDSQVTSLLGYVDGTLWESNASNAITLEGVGKGAHTVRLVATDEAGNVQDVSVQVQMGSKSSPGAGPSLLLGVLALAGFLGRRRPNGHRGTQSR